MEDHHCLVVPAAAVLAVVVAETMLRGSRPTTADLPFVVLAVHSAMVTVQLLAVSDVLPSNTECR